MFICNAECTVIPKVRRGDTHGSGSDVGVLIGVVNLQDSVIRFHYEFHGEGLTATSGTIKENLYRFFSLPAYAKQTLQY